ncbi:hypothetical protein [Megalodesulfovibrio paquesii]
MTAKTITIDLSQSREATSSLNREGLIQQEAFSQFCELLKGILARIEPFKASLQGMRWPMRTHDVITVDGVRGSGKTTFILSACKILLEPNRKEYEAFSEVEFLDIIDPTLVETREHVFVSIINAIRDRVDEHFRRHDHGDARHRYEQWSKSLLPLAGGITILDGIGKDPLDNEEWMDEQYVLEQGLKNARSGSRLERNFHEFVKESLGFLNKKAFLLVFDDIDTDFSKGWGVLEIIRKYLTTPQLMVVLSGDLKLYSLLVEKQQWERLGQNMIAEVDDANRFKPIVSELQDQYLLKILKPAHRIELRGLEHYSAAPYVLRVTRSAAEKQSESDISAIFDAFCTNVLHRKAVGDKRRLVQMLLQRPPRTVIALLQAYADALRNDNTEQEKNALDKAGVAPGKMQGLYLALAHVFHMGLTEMGYSAAELERFDPSRSIERLIVQLNRNGLFGNGASLRPVFTNDLRNDALMCLSGVFAWHMASQPTAYLHYLLKLCLTEEVIRDQQHPEIINAYMRHVNLLGGETTLHIARSYLSFCHAQPIAQVRRPALEQGTILVRAPGKFNLSDIRDQLFREDEGEYTARLAGLKAYWSIIDTTKTAQGVIQGVFLNTMDSLAKGITSWHIHFAKIPYSINLIFGKSNPHYSFFSLFGALGTLLEGESLDAVLPVASQTRMFPVWQSEARKAIRPPDMPDEETGGVLDDNNERAPIDSAFDASWNTWRKMLPLKLGGVSSTAVLARAWTRFYYSLTSISQQLERFNCLAGIVMHRWIVAFLHSVLLEEALEAFGPQLPGGDKLILENAITSDTTFMNLVRKLRKTLGSENNQAWGSTFPLFNWFYSCPVWSLYLDSMETKEKVLDHNLNYLLQRGIIQDLDSFRQALRVQYAMAKEPYPNLFPLLNSMLVVGMSHTINEDEFIEDHLEKVRWAQVLTDNQPELRAAWEQRIATRKDRDTDEGIVFSILREAMQRWEYPYNELILTSSKNTRIFKEDVFPLFKQYVLDQ